MKKIGLLFSVSTLILLSCTNTITTTETRQNNSNDPITAHIDSSINPGENFFLFANNNWFKNNAIPSSESSNGIFRTIQDTINEAVRKICVSSVEGSFPKGSTKQKIGDFYFSGMDTASIEKTGYAPLSEGLKQTMIFLRPLPGCIPLALHQCSNFLLTQMKKTAVSMLLAFTNVHWDFQTVIII
jgi:hypothetical protein